MSGLYIINSDTGRVEDSKISNLVSAEVASGVWMERDVSIIPADYTTMPHDVVFDNITVENIQPIDDADGIKVLGGNEWCNIIVRNSKFINCKKRALKFQARGCVSNNNSLYFDEAPMYPIDFQRGHGRSLNDTITISGTSFTDDTKGVALCLIGGAVGNIYIDGLTQIVEGDTSYLESSSVSTSSAIIRLTEFSEFYADSLLPIIISNAAIDFIGCATFIDTDTTIEKITIENINAKFHYSAIFRGVSGSNVSVMDFIRSYFVSYKSTSLVLTASIEKLTCDIKSPDSYFNTRASFRNDNTFYELFSANSVSGNYKIKNQKCEWYSNINQPPENYTFSSGNGFEHAIVGDLCYPLTPFSGVGGTVWAYVCTSEADGTNTRGLWQELTY